MIGDLEVETTLETTHTDILEATSHPVEAGASITDHSFKRPPELVLRCGWSNASLKALTGILTGIFNGGTMSRADYVSGVYSQLLEMQEAREPVSISTGKRQYENMLITSIVVTEDQKTSQVLMVLATFTGVILVNTRSATLPPRDSQADPASTAETEVIGTQQVTSADPAPGGTVPPNEW